MENKVTLAFCSLDLSKDTEFLKNIQEKSKTKLDIIPKVGYTSICKAYNEVIKESKNDTIILCHNDINILTDGFDKIIYDLFEKNKRYGIIGVVGSNAWEREGWGGKKGIPIGTLVQHNKYHPMCSFVPKWILFSPELRCNDLVSAVTADGMFIAIRRDRIKASFDEKLKGFHFYDVMFTIDNFMENVLTGITYKLDICHYSDGNYSDEWYEAREYANYKYQMRDFKINLPSGGGQLVRKYEGYENLKMIRKQLNY